MIMMIRVVSGETCRNLLNNFCLCSRQLSFRGKFGFTFSGCRFTSQDKKKIPEV